MMTPTERADAVIDEWTYTNRPLDELIVKAIDDAVEQATLDLRNLLEESGIVAAVA